MNGIKKNNSEKYPDTSGIKKESEIFIYEHPNGMKQNDTNPTLVCSCTNPLSPLCLVLFHNPLFSNIWFPNTY